MKQLSHNWTKRTTFIIYGIVCNITDTQTQNNVPMVTKYVM